MEREKKQPLMKKLLMKKLIMVLNKTGRKCLRLEPEFSCRVLIPPRLTVPSSRQ